MASLLIVFFHSIHLLQWGVQFGNYEMSRLLKILSAYGTFCFVFISGFLFQHLSDRYNYLEYLKGRFMRVVVPYLLVSVPAVFAWTFLYQNSGWGIPDNLYDHSWWYVGGFYFLTGQHMAPMWFIPMIATFYLLAPVFRTVDRYPILYWSIPVLIWITWEYPRQWNFYLQGVHFLSAYVIGMCASRYKEHVLEFSYRYRFFLLAACIGLVVYEYQVTMGYQTFYTYLNKLFLTFYLISVFSHSKPPQFRWLAWYAGFNFSVFFLHTYVIAGMKIVFTGAPSQPLLIGGNPVYQLIFFTIVVAVSIALTIAVRKIAGQYSRYLIGS